MSLKCKWIMFSDESLSSLLAMVAQSVDNQDPLVTILDCVTFHNDDAGEWSTTIYYESDYGVWK